MSFFRDVGSEDIEDVGVCFAGVNHQWLMKGERVFKLS